jgi:lipopolysaccharide export system protein LptC
MAPSNTYSRVVAWVKIILPLLALALLSTLFLFSRTPDPNRAIPFANVDVEELAREQSLGQPRFAGTLSDGREVIFTADRATPVAGEPNHIEATDIEARVDLDEYSVLLIVAETGLFDLAAQLADLSNSVGLTTSNGYQLTTDLLRFNLSEFMASSPGPVGVTGPGITLQAGAMEVSGTEGNNLVVFNGGIRMLYDPQR